jgi:uncharacterized membrane protein
VFDVLSLVLLVFLFFLLKKTIDEINQKVDTLEALIKEKSDAIEVELYSLRTGEEPARRPEAVPLAEAAVEQAVALPEEVPLPPEQPSAETPPLRHAPGPIALWFEAQKEKLKTLDWENVLAGNLFLKIGVVAFVLGIGFFLKYSIERGWIAPWGRVLISVAVGNALLIAGAKLLKNRYKLFSEGLFGGGVAILYLSVYAAFALEGFRFIDHQIALVAMTAITLMAGLISIRFDSLTTAVFGLIGGFATPFVITTPTPDIRALMAYVLVLNLGIFLVSVYKRWPLLSWLAFAATTVIEYGAVQKSEALFSFLAGGFGLLFILYSIIPFVNEIRARLSVLPKSSVGLFAANLIAVLLLFLALFDRYETAIKYYSIVTLSLAAYLLVLAFLIWCKKVFEKNLFYIVLSQAMVLLLATPPILFEAESITIVWALESVLLLWLGQKTKQPTFILFAAIGFGLTAARFALFDLQQSVLYSLYHYPEETADYLKFMGRRWLTAATVIASFLGGYFLQRRRPVDLVVPWSGKKLVNLAALRTVFFMALFYFSLIFVVAEENNLFAYFNIEPFFPVLFYLTVGLFVYFYTISEFRRFALFLIYILLYATIMKFLLDLIAIDYIDGNPLMLIAPILQFGAFAAMGILAYTRLISGEGKKFVLPFGTYGAARLTLYFAVALSFLFSNVEVYHVVHFFWPLGTRIALTILWAAFGITLLVFGLAKNSRDGRYVGIALMTAATVKAFFFDMRGVDPLYRTILFILLGVVLFIASFLYKKYEQTDREET